ncbi:retrovirus-related Pol polyprotein from transposon 412 [Trichonephila clavipes]|nr:retrovirus-related Pol polyprotein from transposon 412 [Trichonephila clavipes]
MFNFYRCFIPKAARILAPIVQFLEGYTNQKKSYSSVRKSSEPLKWNENAEQAFLAAKNAIAEATLLRHPITGAQLSLWVDTSGIAIGGTLSQLSQEFALAQKNDPNLQKFLQTDESSLKLELKPYQTPDCDLLCDISTGVPHPFVPTSFRRALFNHLHNISHPGIAASTKLICSRYVWSGMKCQIKKWVQCCESFQKSKIQRHTKTPLGTFSVPDARFSHIHIDIVGPLPPSEGHHYLLTIISRFSRWPEAIPIPDMQAKTICHAIFDTWISRFGCPSIITSDQGTQMRSSMNAEFTRMLGTAKIKTTTYHPKSNEIV